MVNPQGDASDPSLPAGRRVPRRECTDGVFRLRPLSSQDASTLYEAVRESLDQLIPWLPWAHPGYSLEAALAFAGGSPDAWEDGREFSFGVYAADGTQLLGVVGLNSVDRVHRHCNLGYWTRTSAAGRGVASGAARLAARFGLEQASLQRIEIVASVHNVASQRAAERAGARREAVSRNRLYLHGQPHDAVVYSVIAADLA